MFQDRLVIGNDFNELRRMTEWLQTACSGEGLEHGMLASLDLCANELVTNIISYSYEDDRHHDIELELHKTPLGARLTVIDDGRPFNILEAPEHIQPGSLEEAQIGGLGILLVRKMSTCCSYRREAGRNVVAIDLPLQPRQHNA
jgi:anti-sigma regulatory factor (Ser/Thr protein kinase)